jgi:hypothetical protein
MKFISFDQFVKVLESQQIDEATSGEKDYGIFMKYAKSQINYYKRKSAYPKFMKAQNALSLDEIDQKTEIDENEEEYLTQLEDKIKEKIKAEIEKVNQEQIPTEQKKVKRQQLKDQQADALEQAKETLKDKIETEKTNIGERIAADKQKITDRISEFDTDYPIEVDSLKKRWNEFKAEIDLKYAIELNNDILQVKIDATTDTNKQKALMQKAKERDQKLKQDAQKEIETLRQEAKEAEQEMKNRVQNAPAETKEALDKIRDFQEKLGKFMDLAGAYTEDSTEEEIDAVLQARKEMNEVKSKLSVGLLKKAGMATDNNAEEMVSAFEKDAEDAINSFKEVKDLVALKKDDKTPKKGEPATEPSPKEGGSKNTEDLKNKITDKLAKAEKALAAAVSSPNPKQTVIDAIKTQIEKKKKELLGLGESSIDYNIKLSSISRSIDLIMEEIESLSKPWYRKSDGSLNESISQKFSRLLNKRV